MSAVGVRLGGGERVFASQWWRVRRWVMSAMSGVRACGSLRGSEAGHTRCRPLS